MLFFFFLLSHFHVFDLFSCFLYRADMLYEDMKQRYGSQGCYLLKINTRTISAEDCEQIPDPWSQYLQRNNVPNQVRFVTLCLMQ